MAQLIRRRVIFDVMTCSRASGVGPITERVGRLTGDEVISGVKVQVQGERERAWRGEKIGVPRSARSEKSQKEEKRKQ